MQAWNTFFSNGEGGGVVERIAGELTELLLLTLFGHHLKLFGPAEVQHRFLRRLQQEVEAAQHNEGNVIFL